MQKTVGGIYNPQETPEQEFLARYSVRIAQTERLLGDILASGPRDEPRHFVVQGQRGQGKTSLLRKLYLSLRDQPESNGWLVPVLFKEELYGVTSLCRFWEHTAECLVQRPGFERLPAAFEAAWESPHYEKDCFQILDTALKAADIRLVLLIDNIGNLLAKLDRREQQRLREVLHTSNRIQIVGASAAMLEQHYDHGAPFYQFFREVNLGGLNKEETYILLRHLGTVEQRQVLEQVIEHNPGRIETLRRLSAGVPRTLVLLFDILLDRDGNAFSDLERLLDRVTPLYKHRMDDLPPQQQAIVHAVALGWDAMSAGEVARATRLPSKQVSAQLKQLEHANVVQHESTRTKNHLYRLEERFFNIWYLMRNGRPGDRRRALWLVRFLENWCTAEELRARAETHLELLSERRLMAEHAWFMTEALRGAGLDAKTEDRLVKATREYLPEAMREFMGNSVIESLQLADKAVKEGRYEDAVNLLSPHADAGDADAALRLGTIYAETLNRIKDETYYSSTSAEKSKTGAINETTMPYMYKIINRTTTNDWPNMAAEKDNKKETYNLQSRRPDESLRSIRTFTDKIAATANSLPPEPTNRSLLALSIILLWNQAFLEAFEIIDKTLPRLEADDSDNVLEITILMLMASDQTAYARRLFEDQAFSMCNLKERFKVIYYALLRELGESRSDDLQRIGPELVETTNEITEKISELRAYYFSESVHA